MRLGKALNPSFLSMRVERMAADEDGIAILRRRYANGEITRKQYLEMKGDLAGDGKSTQSPSGARTGR